mmetsp:Transcript_36677/g.88372  ORF Transcript_36677/g.88372 Transcript_36677/m.88372 type:complete len:207 (+) Transcript_36677:1161-1781(+)
MPMPKMLPIYRRRKSIARCSFLCKFLFNVSDCFPRIQMLRTDPGTIHNRMTSVQFECIIQLLQPLILKVITRVFNPPVCLHQNRRAKVFVRIPPVGRTCRAAACAEDAFVHAIEFGPILTRLQEFCLSVYLAIFGLKPRFNGAILLVEVTHIRNQIFQHIHVRQGINLGHIPTRFFLPLRVNVTQTGEGVLSIDIHGTRAADSLAT